MLARKYQKGIYLRIDGEKYAEEVKQCHVSTYPTFIFYFCGEERERLEKADVYLLEAKIQQYTQLVTPEERSLESRSLSPLRLRLARSERVPGIGNGFDRCSFGTENRSRSSL